MMQIYRYFKFTDFIICKFAPKFIFTAFRYTRGDDGDDDDVDDDDNGDGDGDSEDDEDGAVPRHLTSSRALKSAGVASQACEVNMNPFEMITSQYVQRSPLPQTLHWAAGWLQCPKERQRIATSWKKMMQLMIQIGLLSDFYLSCEDRDDLGEEVVDEARHRH